MHIHQRRLVLGCFVAAALSIIGGSAAFACQTLATLSANPRSGPVGTVVSLSGGNYSGAANASNIDIHLNSRTGPIVASTRAAANGTFSTTFTVPSSMAVGYHTLIATQTRNGVPVSGTPGRSSFQVTAGTATASAGLSPVTTYGLPMTILATAGGAIVLLGRRRKQALAA